MPENTAGGQPQSRPKKQIEKPLDPRAQHVSLDSRMLGIPKSFYVSLPPGYAGPENSEQRYPTLYLFRGHEHEWIHRQQDRSRHGRTVIDVYRDLLEAGRVGPMILIFPGISSDDNRVPGLLVNFLEPQRINDEPGVGTGRFEDYFINELMAYVDANFRTIASREGRAVDGFSLGGFQSVKIAAQHPDLFCSAGAFDGTFLYATSQGKGVRQRDRVLNNPMLDPAFGSPRDLDYVAANSPANLVSTIDRKSIADVQWLIQSGPEEAEPWHSNFYRAQHLISLLQARKIKNGIDPVLKGATHSWHWADQHMAITMPLHWDAMRAAAAERAAG